MSNLGRPTVIEPVTVQKLEQALREGFSIAKACSLSGISRSTYYEHCGKNQEFMDKMTLAQDWVSERARNVVVKSIESGDLQTAKWWLERKVRNEFGNKGIESATHDKPASDSNLDYLRQIAQAIKEANSERQPNSPSSLSTVD